MLRIGLTGGIGSGKSTVAELFAALAVPVVDADAIAHRLASAGQPGYQRIVERFGAAILQADREIDRQRLRVRVFDSTVERKALEAILHPLVRAAIDDEVGRLNAPYCIIVIPLLVEAGLLDLVDRVLVVDADEAQQIERVKARNGLGAEDIRKIIASQAPRLERLSHADDVIRNNGDLRHLRNEVEHLHSSYLALAAVPS